MLVELSREEIKLLCYQMEYSEVDSDVLSDLWKRLEDILAEVK